MSDEPNASGAPKPGQDNAGSDASREQKMAEIKARAEALRAARAAAKGTTAPPPEPSTAAVPAPEGEPAAAAEASRPSAPAARDADAPAGTSREEQMAAIRARAEAMKAARASGTAPAAAPSAAATASAAAPARPAAPTTVDVPVSSLNPGGRPGTPPQAPALEAFGTINQSVEIRAAAGENENIKKLLGGLGAYQNPLRGDVWQIDYRYYAEARRRLEAAGYTMSEKDYLGRPVATWSPTSRGWTRVET
jgi:hypothetical protein